jgi:hypothetical protein
MGLLEFIHRNDEPDDDEEPETTDPRDMVGDNPTGRARRSSARRRRRENRKLFDGTPWEKK